MEAEAALLSSYEGRVGLGGGTASFFLSIMCVSLSVWRYHLCSARAYVFLLVVLDILLPNGPKAGSAVLYNYSIDQTERSWP